MNISEPFTKATDHDHAGHGRDSAFRHSGLPRRSRSAIYLVTVDFPTIQVNANLPGANPDTMASAVATPLEKQFSAIAGIDSMTSASTLGSTSITLQFDLSRSIISPPRSDVQTAAISRVVGQLPPNMPSVR